MEPNEPRGNIPDELLDDPIDAYLAGAMEPGEIDSFEARLAAEPELAVRVERLHAVLGDAAGWCGEAPPGIERADAVHLPATVEAAPARRDAVRPVPSRAATTRAGIGWWRQAAAAMLIFVAGIAVGSLGGDSGGAPLPRDGNMARETPGQSTPETEPTPRPDLPEGSKTLALATPQAAIHALPDIETAPPAPAPADDTFAARLARVKPRLISQENGRMIVQTEIPNTGGQAIWIIDPAWNSNREGEE